MLSAEVRPLSADVIVAGGGSAGSAAAIAAARRGHSVLLIEEANTLGGTSTVGGVWEWFAGQEGVGNIFEHVRAELRRYDVVDVVKGRHYLGEPLKTIWQLMAEQAGVRLLLHASTVVAETDGARVKSASIASCSHGLRAEGRFFIDCTGEGDLAALCGADFEQGDPEAGRTLHMTLTFTLLDTGRPVTAYLPPGLEPIDDEEGLPGLRVHRPIPDGRLYCNMTKIMGRDPTDPLSLTAAECEARRQVARIVHYLQHHGHPNHVLASTAAKIGIREGRRIIGDYVLTEADISGPESCDFEDGVAVATAQIDFHSLTRPGEVGWRQRVEPYAIPLRCLLVRGFDNLLVAGKCASADQVAQSSIRMTPTCCAMGQAVGTAVALALEQGMDDVRQVDIGQLRRELTAEGVELDPTRHEAFAPGPTPAREDRL